MALSLVVRAHIEGCDDCRKTHGLAEAIGGIFLESTEPMAMDSDALSRVMRQLDLPEPPEPAPELQGRDTPALALRLRQHAERGRRWLWPGLWVRPILKDRAHGTRVYLLGGAAGTTVPRHRHSGPEMIQILQGELLDGDDRYEAGDFLEADRGSEHQPRAGSDQECICVVGSKGVPYGLIGLFIRART